MKVIVGVVVGWFLVFAVWGRSVTAEDAYRHAGLPVEQRVDDLLHRMTLEEKVEQLTQKSAGDIQMDEAGVDAASMEKLFGDRSPGVLCAHFGDDLFQSARRLAAAQQYLRTKTRLGIPALTAPFVLACWLLIAVGRLERRLPSA